MKFAKQYTEAYRELPPSWPAFKYKALKKTIGKIVQELEDRGIEVQDASEAGSPLKGKSGLRHCVIDYYLEGSPGNLEPYLLVNFLDDDQTPVDLAAEISETGGAVSTDFTNDDTSMIPLIEANDDEEGFAIEVGSGRGARNSLRIKITSRKSLPVTQLFPPTSLLTEGLKKAPTVTRLGSAPVSSLGSGGISSDVLPKILEDDAGSILVGSPESITTDFREHTIPKVRFDEIPTPPPSRTCSPPSQNVTIPTSPTSPKDSSSFLSVPKRPRRVRSARQIVTINTDRFSPLESSPLSGDSDDFSGSDAKSMSGTSFLSDTSGGSSMKLFIKTDCQFFTQLAEAVNAIAQFESVLKSTFDNNLERLTSYLAKAASPYNKDMYAWRHILATYLESEIWLINGVKDRPVTASREQLSTFELSRLKSMRSSLKTPSSDQALDVFLQMNRELLAMKHFDEINHTAVRKILKKHDKRTRLTASEGFTHFLEDKSFFIDNIARVLIFTIQERLVTIVPQPDDYCCPICQDIYWKPIRLVCGHVFCVRCLVKAQIRNVRHCPVCRKSEAISAATADHLDVARMNLLKLYFPKEVKQKAIESGKERAAEDIQNMFGVPYVPHRSPIPIVPAPASTAAPTRRPSASRATTSPPTSPSSPITEATSSTHLRRPSIGRHISENGTSSTRTANKDCIIL
ncbi:SPX domain-containing protein [Phlyctochytrium arcticum]|nr:SPX domain-containing protein [Phlyctochytrium arcticum]